VLVTYRFDGPADDIYAKLVVRLHHTVAFQSTDLWKSAADFKTQTGTKLGFTLTRETEGSSRLEVYFGFLTEFRETPTAFHPPAQSCPRQRAALGSCPLRPQP
jgi:hypothetical protein